MPANHKLAHRTEIDGLRALAILPVLLYHARLGCPGGYVGVEPMFEPIFQTNAVLISSLHGGQ